MKIWDLQHEQLKIRQLLDASESISDLLGRMWLYTARTKRERRAHARL